METPVQPEALSGEPTYPPGTIVFAVDDIHNDGSLPGVPEGELLAAAGTRGVVVKVGHIEEVLDVEVFVVRFEAADGVLGPPVGCFVEEIGREAGAAAPVLS
ncbi:nitrogen fixation protein NifZ [Azoarcus sp. TTM-91]|uniref:nitrogen fixation protein NifZ n=1 Tax=Azoarcus sp. TTM-91 TaxID=2691581 RepID=UPI00145CC947|nr:nitrogen fixation protein NifZ [Azoarcus sp. TTM-91]NMG33902.1 nitrogen fixation protein NifZ [Azoarcus sp. TTM-91]